tara:strand:- start:405 stop:1391 length:987 start_codon:yes stop_codon:yes gene_type:complete
MKKKKILITGGLGLIGSNLAVKLYNLGHKISIIDDCSSGSIKNIPKKIFRKINFKKISILNENVIKNEIKKNDIIFHLAASVGVKNILSNKLKSIETNVSGTEKIFKYCNRYKKKIFYASSSEVYGKGQRKPLDERDGFKFGNVQTFRWSYAVSKLLDEYLSQAYILEKKLDILVIRFFNIVGPNQTGSYGMVFPRFIKSALNNKDINVYGTGKQTRSFLHVEDATDALIRLMNKNYFKDVINLGGIENISILNLAKRIKEISKSKSKIVKQNYKFAYSNQKKFSNNYEDIMYRHPSTKKLRRMIKFSPKYSLNKIIKNLLQSNNSVN